MPYPPALFSDNSARYIENIDGLHLDQLCTCYTFMALDQYDRLIQKAPDKAMQVYWSEILYRAHWTAIAAIVRNRRWVSAMSSAVKDQNALAFSAALRGFIESVGDTHTGLQNIPTTLALNSAKIKDAVLGKLRDLMVNGTMEDDLVHFAYARKLKKGEIEPTTHRAKTIQEYIEILSRGKIKSVADLYSQLCDITHPGASSVWIWVRQPAEYEVHLDSGREGEIIAWLLAEYRETMDSLICFAFGGPMITLAVLNYFPISSLHTPALASWDFSNIPLWQKIERDLNVQG